MIKFILSLPTWTGCGFAMVSTTVFGLAVYFVSNKLIEKAINGEGNGIETGELTSK